MASLNDIIDEALDGVDFGAVTLTLKRSQSNVTSIDLTKVSRRQVRDNVQALTLVGSMLKLLQEAATTGDVTFTIVMKQGDARELMTHDFKRRNLKNGQYE